MCCVCVCMFVYVCACVCACLLVCACACEGACLFLSLFCVIRVYYAHIGPPLPPNPRLFLPFDASAVRLTWQKPFTWSDVADITNYTIRVFSTANYVWSSMTIKIIESANDHSFACDLSTKACTPLGQNRTSSDLLTYYVQINSIARETSCYVLQFYVSAFNTVGESYPMLADKDFVVGRPRMHVH